MLKTAVHFGLVIVLLVLFSFVQFGCGQIGMPTGGPKDSLPPILAKANPQLRSLQFNAKEIKLTFDEYVEVNDIQKNVFISPLTKYNPQVSYSLHTVTVKLKDTLKPNTTYTLYFGDAIRDINEGNVFKDFSYTFSTGNHIDSLTLEGKVTLAETGVPDSTLLVLLYRHADDTTVVAKKPDYIAKLSGEGKFKFTNLPADSFRIYALKDNDAGKTYNIKTELFAFRENNQSFLLPNNGDSIILYAYQQEKQKEITATTTGTGKGLKAGEKKFSYTISSKDKIDLINPIEIGFNTPIKRFNKERIIIADTNYKQIAVSSLELDTVKNKLFITNNWKPEEKYKLIIEKNAFGDSSKYLLSKADTLTLKAKATEDYSKLLLRFQGLNLSKNPVLQFVSNDEIKMAVAIKANEWRNDLFPPGEYKLRILYDTNGNGVWDPGNFRKNIQPELVIALPSALNARQNWENERDISVGQF